MGLSGTLYLPAGYDKVKKEKLPLLIWAYPTEYKDKNSADKTIKTNEFTFLIMDHSSIGLKDMLDDASSYYW
jgi:dipeptidyl aminopeptidase/acylaminoacyl peptidase